jgi:aspartate/methionine/tyrosine aminotransferase
VAFASQYKIIILSDEVFRPLFHSDINPPSILSLGYTNVISTGSTSKALALPGIRVGWITSPNKAIIAATVAARDYTTIAVSQLDDQIACFALSEAVRTRILARSRAIASANLDLLEAFVAEHSSMCSWVRPTGGSVAFVRITKNDVPVEDKSFCKDLLKVSSTLIVPGGFCFGTDNAEDYQGYLRIGFVSEKGMLEAGLAALGRYLQAPDGA